MLGMEVTEVQRRKVEALLQRQDSACFALYLEALDARQAATGKHATPRVPAAVVAHPLGIIHATHDHTFRLGPPASPR